MLLVTLSIATRNTFELLEDKSRLLISGVAQQVRLFLEPAQAQVEALAGLIESGRLDPADPTGCSRRCRPGSPPARRSARVVFLDPSGWLMAAIRAGRAPVAGDRRLAARSRRPPRPSARRSARREREAYWGPPVYLKDRA